MITRAADQERLIVADGAVPQDLRRGAFFIDLLVPRQRHSAGASNDLLNQAFALPQQAFDGTQLALVVATVGRVLAGFPKLDRQIISKSPAASSQFAVVAHVLVRHKKMEASAQSRHSRQAWIRSPLRGHSKQAAPPLPCRRQQSEWRAADVSVKCSENGDVPAGFCRATRARQLEGR